MEPNSSLLLSTIGSEVFWWYLLLSPAVLGLLLILIYIAVSDLQVLVRRFTEDQRLGLPNRFQGTELSEDRLLIVFRDMSIPGCGVTIRAWSGDRKDTIDITLDDSGMGQAEWAIPDWCGPKILLSHTTSSSQSWFWDHKAARQRRKAES